MAWRGALPSPVPCANAWGAPQGLVRRRAFGDPMTNQARFTIASLLEGKSALVQITPVAADEVRPQARARGSRDRKDWASKLKILRLCQTPRIIRSTNSTAPISRHRRLPTVSNGPRQKRPFKVSSRPSGPLSNPGAASASPDGPRSVEIGFDGEGRPTYPGCLLSISDTGTIAAAICFWLGALTPTAPPASGAEAARPQMRTFPVKTRILAFLVLLSLLFLFGLGFWKILELWWH